MSVASGDSVQRASFQPPHLSLIRKKFQGSHART
jgi:hypothetical protein